MYHGNKYAINVYYDRKKVSKMSINSSLDNPIKVGDFNMFFQLCIIKTIKFRDY